MYLEVAAPKPPNAQRPGGIPATTQPVTFKFATDSAAMFMKAREMLKAAKERSLNNFMTPNVTRNPFGKELGLQRDGDMWKVAWQAIGMRGFKSQDPRRVKGHATSEDINEGRSSEKDEAGNDYWDELADDGVLSIGGAGLVLLRKWLAEKMQDYQDLMARVHRMIAAVLKAEKGERERPAEKT